MANTMQFWGVEVKPKESCTVPLEEGGIIHISQATLGEIKKDKETVIIHVKVGETKLVLGLLNQDTPQLSCDLVFDSDFEISHNWKNGSIHLMGYKAETSEQGDEFDSSDEEDEDVPVAEENAQPKPAVAAPAAKAKVDNKPTPVEDDDSSDDEDFEEGDSDEEMASSDEEDEDDSEESEDEKPVVAADASKKRANPAAKTPEPKKAKIVATPSKSDSKKSVVHPDTPHPKKEGKTPAGNKSESKKGAASTAKKGEKTPAGDKSPKSAGDVACGSCKKTFKSEVALQSHSKAKHGAN